MTNKPAFEITYSYSVFQAFHKQKDNKKILDSKHVLKVYFKPRRKNPEFEKPAWLKNDHLRGSQLIKGPFEQVHWSAAHEILISKIGVKENFYFTVKSVHIYYLSSL